MADGRRYCLNTQLDIERILLEAQSRWLRPAEICEILKNYQKFHIAPEPPKKPPSGSLFLFDRKVLRYFRKDGHNWRKKKDGKTVKEAHERLKAGSVDVLHCYYAHGEINENFQRRSYWMLEEDLMHIVLVHYLEVKGSKTNFSNAIESEEVLQSTLFESCPRADSLINNDQVHSQTTDSSSLNSAQMSEYDYEDTQSDNHQASSRYDSFAELQQSEDGPIVNLTDVSPRSSNILALQSPGEMTQQNIDVELVSFPQGSMCRTTDTEFRLPFNEFHKEIAVAPSWEDVFSHCSSALQMLPMESTNMQGFPTEENVILGRVLTDDFGVKETVVFNQQSQTRWQVGLGDGSPTLPMWSLDRGVHTDADNDLNNRFQEHRDVGLYLEDKYEPLSVFSVQQNESPEDELQVLHKRNISFPFLQIDGEKLEIPTADKQNSASVTKNPLINVVKVEDGLQKLDSFSRWMSKELADVDKAKHMSGSDDIWATDESGNVIEDSNITSPAYLEDFLLGPSLSQEQLFSIHDYSPNWAYTDSETKVLITGSFLRDRSEVENCEWSCMFGEVEVPAEVLGDGVLRCHAPVHEVGRVPFCVTSSNRVACSEVREFEYVEVQNRCMDTSITKDELFLCVRLAKLLSPEAESQTTYSINASEKSHMYNKINLWVRENNDDWNQLMNHVADKSFSVDTVKEQLLQKLFKDQLHAWLIEKAEEGGKSLNILDKDGQGVLHLVAGLGYDWAIMPIIAAGINVNFRDVRGWTALHWAACYGRERTVVALVSLGGAAGALTDPTPQFPSGQTAADLSSFNGHKGIAGYLAEAALTSHLSSLTLDQSEVSGTNATLDVSEQSADNGDVPLSLSLKDSLSAVCNAAQAAARIQEVFRVNSFCRRQLIEYENDKFGMSAEHALALVSVKSNHSGPHDEPAEIAAIRIQKRFRGWKGRKKFLVIRQRIVKIQAHVRGHQVRKTYRKIIWSVGIVEKVILRWRRKGSGLRGFKQEALTSGSSIMTDASKDDDYDFLHEGRKQTEARLEKALARVRSMVQYPEARDQYRRLRNVVTEFQVTKMFLDECGDSCEGDDLFDLETLLGDDSLMPTVG